eukprot:14494444-Alexandrium_andersonii.AAC.1
MRTDYYQARMASNYLEDPKFYKPEPELHELDALHKHAVLIRKHVPQRWLPRRPLSPSMLARPYTTCKGKCLAKAAGGLSCSKPHAHDREI